MIDRPKQRSPKRNADIADFNVGAIPTESYEYPPRRQPNPDAVSVQSKRVRPRAPTLALVYYGRKVPLAYILTREFAPPAVFENHES